MLNAAALKYLFPNKNQPVDIITNEKIKNKDKTKTKHNKKNEYVRLHLNIHVRHVKQPQLISLKFFAIFKLTYGHTDLLGFM